MNNTLKKSNKTERSHPESRSQKEVFNQTYSIRNTKQSRPEKETKKVFRRYSFDDNGGGYMGL
ncbi:MAG: hypothetical protein ACJ748_06615 [Flavisolibacter sp.]